MQCTAVCRHRFLASLRPAPATGRRRGTYSLVVPTRERKGLRTLTTSETKVQKILVDTIKATGPISFATYMQMCLSHPTAGYYMNPSNSVLGARGDFTTSPEISQVFGELVGVWLLSQWMAAGNARKIRLVELGPGRGTLMQDILRVISQFPAARTAVSEVHLVETSLAMQAQQKDKLGTSCEANNWALSWHASIDDIPHDTTKFTLIIAHEFFDALPFHLLQKTTDGWKEIMITLAHDPSGPTTATVSRTAPLSSSLDRIAAAPAIHTQTHFREVISRSLTASSTVLGASAARFKSLPVGSRIEVSPAAFKIARKVGELVHADDEAGSSSAGSALIVDYGGDKAYGSSFRVRFPSSCVHCLSCAATSPAS
ncbi:S-adenosyl-L-methionine-dependent methyltransferase [Amylocystis lapponica]|nr:S-adenosyl-L-methionine-dependent methyltransferase [Amylocystis lapponica]